MVWSQRRLLRINALLKSIYTDLRHPASFSSPYTLFRATKQKNPKIIFKDVEYSEYLRQQKGKHKYSIGDHMRKAINKGSFSKSYKFKNFSEKLYEIIDTVHTRPSMYCLKDLRTGNV